MLRFGPGNSRIKDFWDVAMLAQRFAFDGETLRTAIEETLRRRRTVLGPELPDALRPAFYDNPARLEQWRAFLAKAGGTLEGPTGLDQVGELVRAFLGPVRESPVQNEVFTRVWPPGGPWRVAATAASGGETDV